MTTLFYAPPAAFRDGVVELPEDEGRHMTKVLRHRVGDEIVVVDGVGGRHRVRLAIVDRRRVMGEVVVSDNMTGEPKTSLTVGLGILKNTSRFETFVEKAVELGVTEIVPLITARSEHARLREHRLENIMIAAMKQSGRCRLPLIHPARPLREVVDGVDAPLRFVCHEGEGVSASILEALASSTSPGNTCVLVGPEGGFSDSEVDAARASGWTIVSLGPRRLRAETAAIVAAGSIMLQAAR
jgi:16S rRNA (uracil1498-N3)-methyltransferase